YQQDPYIRSRHRRRWRSARRALCYRQPSRQPIRTADPGNWRGRSTNQPIMKTHITIAAGMLAANLASAALVGAASGAWSASATDHDGAVDELYSHLLGGANNYLAPDSIENRFANGGFL